MSVLRQYSVLPVHGAVVKPCSTGCLDEKNQTNLETEVEGYSFENTLLGVLGNYVHYHQCLAISIGNHVSLLLSGSK